MGGLFGGGGDSGPSAEELRQQRLEDSRGYWTNYQEQRRNIVDTRATALKDLAQMTAIGGLSQRAAANRESEIQADYDRQWSSLHSGATYGLLQDVYREQGATGSLEDYFTGQWGVIEPLDAETDPGAAAAEADQRAAAALMQQDDENQPGGRGQVYQMT